MNEEALTAAYGLKDPATALLQDLLETERLKEEAAAHELNRIMEIARQLFGAVDYAALRDRVCGPSQPLGTGRQQ